MANKMQEVKIEKVVLSVGGTAEKLEKGVKLLNKISEKKPAKIKSVKRIPTLGVRPGLEVGCLVTLRGEKAIELLKRLLEAMNNTLRKKQVSENSFSFGIKEYIEIPGMLYQRDIGVIGLDVSVAFRRAGRRVSIRKIKRGIIPKKQNIAKEEIIKFMEENFNTKFK